MTSVTSRKKDDMSELLPCPFCGEPVLWREYGDGSGNILHFDNDCSMAERMPFFFISYALAVAFWNRRASPWISVEERLPEKNTEVLAWVEVDERVEKGFPEFLRYYWGMKRIADIVPWRSMWDNSVLDESYFKVVAWMPLPKPPKEG